MQHFVYVLALSEQLGRRSGGPSLEYRSYWALTCTFSGNGALYRDDEQFEAQRDYQPRHRSPIDRQERLNPELEPSPASLCSRSGQQQVQDLSGQSWTISYMTNATLTQMGWETSPRYRCSLLSRRKIRVYFGFNRRKMFSWASTTRSNRPSLVLPRPHAAASPCRVVG